MPEVIIELKPDKNARYDGAINIKLIESESMVAKSHSPSNVVKAKELKFVKVDLDNSSKWNSKYYF